MIDREWVALTMAAIELSVSRMQPDEDVPTTAAVLNDEGVTTLEVTSASDLSELASIVAGAIDDCRGRRATVFFRAYAAPGPDDSAGNLPPGSIQSLPGAHEAVVLHLFERETRSGATKPTSFAESMASSSANGGAPRHNRACSSRS